MSMSEVANAAFYAAHIRHLRRLITEGVSGPFLCPTSYFDMSSRLFSEPFYNAQQNFIQRGAVSVMNESDIHPPMILPDRILPD